MNIFKVLKNDIYGRYMVAAKNLKRGELIIQENPVIIGPHIGSAPICFKCCRVLFKTTIKCNICNTALICSNNCNGIYHCENECKSLINSNINFSENLDAITVFRCILLKKYNKPIWDEIISLESHVNQRKLTPIWIVYESSIVPFLNSKLSKDDVSDEIVQKICGILDVNSFDIRLPQFVLNEMQCVRGLYLEAALMAHDCVGNVHLAVDNNFIMYIHAARDIKENEIIFFNYSNPLQGTLQRQKHLMEGKYFKCSCKRCADPRELKTFLSCLKCPKCRKNTLLPSEFSNWVCDSCKKSFNKALIETTINLAQNMLTDADLNEYKVVNNLKEKFLRSFHPNHFLLLELEQNLVKCLSNNNLHNLKQKIVICNNLLDIYKILEPGLSRLQGIILYELYESEIKLAHEEHLKNKITSEILLEKLLRIEKILKECLQHLLYEPKNSPEGFLAKNALEDLKNLRNSIQKIRIKHMGKNKKSK